MPPALRDRLRDEPDAERAALDAVWDLLGRVDPTPGDAPDPDEAWAALRRRRPEVAPDDAAPRPSSNGQAPSASSAAATARTARRPSRPTRARRWGRWAGALAAVLVVAVGAAWLWRQPVTVTATPGQQRSVTLPDGSTADLNSGTALTYQRGFRAWPFVDADRRRVRLDGEAFFSVRDGDRPFVVRTANARVRVTGTRFNVRARPSADSATAVAVAAGRVEVRSSRGPGRAVVLEQGQASRVRNAEAAPTPPQPTDLAPVLAWRQDGFAVTEAPLSAVVRELERRYDTTVALHSSVARTKAPLTLYYPKPTPLNTVLRDLCTALDLNYRPTSRGYEIFAGPNRR